MASVDPSPVALASFMASGAFARHVRRTRLAYAARRDIVLDALGKALGAQRLNVSGTQAGFHMVWWPPAGLGGVRSRRSERRRVTVMGAAARRVDLRELVLGVFRPCDGLS